MECASLRIKDYIRVFSLIFIWIYDIWCVRIALFGFNETSNSMRMAWRVFV